MSTKWEKQKREAQTELNKNQRRFKKRRITMQIRIDTDVHRRLRSLARKARTTISKFSSEVIRRVIGVNKLP